MTELKTLKDITRENEFEFDSLKALKAEAVKWVKHWDSIDKHCVKCSLAKERSQSDFAHFFNLTEDDLE